MEDIEVYSVKGISSELDQEIENIDDIYGNITILSKYIKIDKEHHLIIIW